MNVNTVGMQNYADFLEDHSRQIQNLCQQMEQLVAIAAQCMDQQSGVAAAGRLMQNMETIRTNVPMADDACQRLILSLGYIRSAGSIFGR